MAQIKWITPSGDLGTYAENSELSIQLEAASPLAPVSSLGFDPRTSMTGNGRQGEVSAFISDTKNRLVITSRDLPGLARTGSFPNEQCPQFIAPQFIEFDYPYRGGLNKSNTTPAPLAGPIGISSIGVVFFGPSAEQYVPGMVPGSRWTLNANEADIFGEDPYGGHPAPQAAGMLPGPNGAPGVYHYHDTQFINNNAWSDIPGWDGVYTHPNGHSRIIGWAADGYPIYGPWGYRNANDPASGVKRMQSGYTASITSKARPADTQVEVRATAIKTNIISVRGIVFVGMKIDLVDKESWAAGSIKVLEVRPDGIIRLNRIVTVTARDQLRAYFSVGVFLEDWSYTGPVGTNLDSHNGRYCVTPDYPSGTYAYFATEDIHGRPMYPYIIGPTYYGSTTVDSDEGVADLTLPSQLALTFSLLSGTLPPGTQVDKNGLIFGYPIVTDPGSPLARRYDFTIRISDSLGQVTDRGFAISVNNIIPPRISAPVVDQTTNSFGIYFDSDFVSLQLSAIEANPQANLTWTVAKGALPPGLTLDSTGLISGFALAAAAPGPLGSGAFDVGRFDQFVWDFEGATLSRTYNFTIRLYDGINYIDQKYNILIYNKQYFRCDNTIILVDTDIFTADRDGYEYPAITTPATALPSARQNQYYAFRFQAHYFNIYQPVKWRIASGGPARFDQDGDNVYHSSGQPFDSKGFDQSNLSLPSGLSIDPDTGWISGILGDNTAYEQQYTFQIVAYVDVGGSIRESQPVTYTLRVLQSIADLITWESNTNLGSIDNGRISTLRISANTVLGDSLNYSVMSGEYLRLPQGLTLTPNGDLIGRVTFDYFTIDGYTSPITFDKTTQTYDSTFTFKVLAFNGNTITTTANTNTGTLVTTSFANATVYSEKQFSITVKNVNNAPFEDLYFKALLPADLRSVFHSIVSDPTLVTSEVIYRPDDPYFGIPTDLRILAVPGLRPESAATLMSAIQDYHYDKHINFGTIRKAVARNIDGSVKYEVLYLDVLDYNKKTETASQLPITANVATSILRGADGTVPAILAPYYGATTLSNVLGDHGNLNIYSNSFSNMINEMVSGIGFQNQGALPDWMTSIQPETGQALGFVHALVLAYTNPGQGDKLLYRYRSSLARSGYGVGDIMNTFRFVADRYQIDQTMTSNYNTTTGKFNTSRSTSFDNIPSTGTVNQGGWVTRSVAGLGAVDLYSIDYAPDYGFMAVGQGSTILTSRSGEEWQQQSKFIDLTYTVSPISPVNTGDTVFTFDYSTLFHVGDELVQLPRTQYHSYISAISQRIRLSGNLTATVSSGANVRFQDLTTGANTYANTVSSSSIGSNSLIMDDISNLARGQSVFVNGDAMHIQSMFSDITISSPGSLSDLPLSASMTFSSVLTSTSGNVPGDSKLLISNTSKLSPGMGVFGITVSSYTDAAASWSATTGTSLTVSVPTSKIHGQILRGMRVLGSGLPASSYISDVLDSGDTQSIFVSFSTSTVAAGSSAVLTFLASPVVADDTVIQSLDSTSITLSSPLINTLPNGADSFLQFGLPTVPLNNVSYANNRWIAVSSGGTVIDQLPGASSWNSRDALKYGDLYSIGYGDGTYVAVGSEGIITYSSDLTTWSPPVFVSGASEIMRSVAYHNGTWVAVGDSGTILTSVDNGLTWSLNSLVTSYNLNKVKYFGKWIAVGAQGTVLTSTDAITWTVYSVGASNSLNALTFINNIYYVGGAQGFIATSSDAETWTIGYSTVTTDLKSFGAGQGSPVVVGTESTILSETKDFTVDWAIRQIPFDQFNLHSVTHLAALGYRVADGDLLIYAQQEGFGGTNDGWNLYSQPYGTSSDLDAAFDSYTVVPGYNESLANVAISNQRAGIWRVNIDEVGTVSLSFQRPVGLNQTVTINNEAVKLFFDPTIKPGNTVPSYTPTNIDHPFVTEATVFDGSGTRFASNKDTYTEPGTLDKYIKFPKTGVFR